MIIWVKASSVNAKTDQRAKFIVQYNDYIGIELQGVEEMHWVKSIDITAVELGDLKLFVRG